MVWAAEAAVQNIIPTTRAPIAILMIPIVCLLLVTHNTLVHCMVFGSIAAGVSGASPVCRAARRLYGIGIPALCLLGAFARTVLSSSIVLGFLDGVDRHVVL